MVKGKQSDLGEREQWLGVKGCRLVVKARGIREFPYLSNK